MDSAVPLAAQFSSVQRAGWADNIKKTQLVAVLPAEQREGSEPVTPIFVFLDILSTCLVYEIPANS